MSFTETGGLSEAQSLYEILEVRPDASPAEIRAAYLRAKSSYQRDSLALYSLMGEEDATRMLRQIEEAFMVLSNPDRRRLYDQSSLKTITPGQVISIDRVPPMAQVSDGDELLIPPSTDFSGAAASETAPAWIDSAATSQSTTALTRPQQSQPTLTAPVQHAHKAAPTPVAPVITGQELREVRERKGVSIDYLVEITRIRKTYILAIETENFEALPAAVYIRGFINQITRELHIPSEPLTTEYLKRYSEWRNRPELSNSRK